MVVSKADWGLRSGPKGRQRTQPYSSAPHPGGDLKADIHQQHTHTTVMLIPPVPVDTCITSSHSLQPCFPDWASLFRPQMVPSYPM